MTSLLDDDLEVRFRTDPNRWPDVEVRGYVTPDLEILSRAKGGDGRTIVGILVPFGRRQRIHDGLEEMIRRGAANHQLRAPSRMKLAREHIRFGGKLIGRAVELRDDAAGLWGALRATPGVQDGDETLALVEDGALDELSIGFRARQDKVHRDGLVERVKIDVLETAVVLEGAYGRAARITGLRSVTPANADGDLDEDEPDGEAGEQHERAAGIEAPRLAAARRRLALHPPAAMIG